MSWSSVASRSGRFAAALRQSPFLFLSFFVLVLLRSAWSSTVLVAKAQNGLVLATNGLHSLESSSLISSTKLKRFFHLAPNVVVGFAGSGTEFHKLYAKLTKAAAELESSGDSGAIPVKAVAHYCQRLVNRHHPTAHLIVAGCDSSPRSPDQESVEEEYRIFEILPQGTLLEQDYALAGSGGSLLHSLFDDFYSRSQGNCDASEVLDLCQRALRSTRELDLRSRGKLSMWIMAKPAVLRAIPSLAKTSQSKEMLS